jgi:hypothetical protein
MFYSLTIDGTTSNFPSFPALHGFIERFGKAAMEPNGTCTRFGRVVGTWAAQTVTLTKSYAPAAIDPESDYWERDRAVQHVTRALRTHTTMVNGLQRWATDLQGNRSLRDLAAYFAVTTGVNRCGATYAPGFAFTCTLPAGHANAAEHHDTVSDAPATLVWHDAPLWTDAL